ncbi:DNA polymerase III subunit delta, partial [Candidatus Zixiibacteriota bacterium]
MAYSYDDLMKDIDRGQLRPVYFFYGPEEFRKEQAVQALIGKLVPRELRDFNLDILYGDETDAGQILDRISTLPMMAERRVVLIRDVAALSPSSKKQLPVHLKTAFAHACLIMTAGQIDVRKAFYRDLRRVAQEFIFGLLKRQEIPDWICERAREYGKSIDPQAIQMLWDGFQSNLVALDNEISKLAIYTAERDQIRSEDVSAVVGELRAHTVFEFCDAICFRDLPKAMILLSCLMEAGITPFNIIWQLREHLKNLVSIG